MSAERPARVLAVRDAPQLLALERAKLILAECNRADEVKEIRDQAVAVVAYYRERADALEIQNEAAEIRLRAERRLGELLREMPKAKGHRFGDDAGGHPESPPALADIGITKKQSSMWQRIGAIEEAQFEARVAEAKESGVELTTTRVLGLSRHPAAKADEAAREDERPGRAFSFDAEVAAPVKALRRAVQRCDRPELEKLAEQLRAVLDRIADRLIAANL